MSKTHRDFGRALANPSEEREQARKKELRFWVGSSVALHLALVAVFAVAPAPVARPLPAVLTVKLVAGVPAARPKASAPKAVPAKAKASPPKPKSVPKAKPAPKKKVLPKKATASKPKKKARPRELDFDEALAQLRDEMGEPEVPPAAEPTSDDASSDAADSSSVAEAAGTTDAQLAAWVSATIRHVRGVYVTPPEFLTQNLVTHLRVTLTAAGMVVGNPKIVQSSGNPYWDDNAVRALVRASPLPAPPKPGVWAFAFPSMEQR